MLGIYTRFDIFLDPSIFRIYSYCNSGNWKQNTRSSSSYVCTRWGGKWKSTTVASTSRTPRKVVFWIQTLIPRKKTRVRPRDPLASFVVDFYEPLEKWHQNKLYIGSCWVRKLGLPRLLFEVARGYLRKLTLESWSTATLLLFRGYFQRSYMRTNLTSRWS